MQLRSTSLRLSLIARLKLRSFATLRMPKISLLIALRLTWALDSRGLWPDYPVMSNGYLVAIQNRFWLKIMPESKTPVSTAM